MTQSKTPITPTSGTPRANAELARALTMCEMHGAHPGPAQAFAVFARQLERELQQATEKLARYTRMSESGETLGDLLDLREKLAAREALREYAAHKLDCKRIKIVPHVDGQGYDSFQGKCTCGLEELLK